jgi:ABC-2 type transport system ATP-binding protein
VVSVEALVVRFSRGPFRKAFTALAGLDLEIRDGDFFALLGQNGAGKSTAMACMLGLQRPTSGTVRVNGVTPTPGAEVYRHIAFLPEEPTYHPYLTINEALTYYARLQGVRNPAPAIADVIDRLALGEHRHLTIAKCSKGMKQKVGIAQCLLHAPTLLFLDEPMRGLDPRTVALFREILTELHRKGATIVMNSHLLSEVEQLANRAAIIDRGLLVRQDSVASLTSRQADTYVIELEGEGDPPPQLEHLARSERSMRGSVAAASLHLLMEHVRQQRMCLVRCELRRTTLEETFLELVSEGKVS